MVNRLETQRASLCAVPATQRRHDGFRIFDALDQHVDAVAAPKKFAVEHHGGHAEYAERLRLVDKRAMLRPRRAVNKGLEPPGRTADRGDHARNIRQFVDLEVVAPEAFEDSVMISPEQAMALREQHAGARIEGIIDR